MRILLYFKSNGTDFLFWDLWIRTEINRTKWLPQFNFVVRVKSLYTIDKTSNLNNLAPGFYSGAQTRLGPRRSMKQ